LRFKGASADFMQQALSIGVLAQRTGANAPTTRYYEEIGLLPAPGAP